MAVRAVPEKPKGRPRAGKRPPATTDGTSIARVVRLDEWRARRELVRVEAVRPPCGPGPCRCYGVELGGRS
jgi:hypothetical protein